MSERNTVRISVFTAEGSIYEHLSQFIESMQEHLLSIPKEYRDEAKIDITSSTFYDSSTVDIDIYYYRPETDAEMTARLDRNAAIVEEKKRRERELFEALKRKFEGA